ncbi:MAG: FAD-binding protein, partial [Rhodospirillales bacterium]|nr:FAD-binding protein [Rhodospirillales bacterium]
MEMPEPDASILARRHEIARALRTMVSVDGVIDHAAELSAYESDGLTAYRQAPLIVVLPSNRDEVAAVLAYCAAEKIKIVPRGAGTSLSGGAL